MSGAAPSLFIPSSGDSPSLHIKANWIYTLYHYLASEAQRPASKRNPATNGSAVLMERAQRPMGPRGVWSAWERPIAAAGTVDEATQGVRLAMEKTAEQVSDALAAAQAPFLESVWPGRLPILDAAFVTLEERFVPAFPSMAARQAQLLGLCWPEHIDGCLVTDCSDRVGGYSEPLTIDVERHTGLDLCEALLHEITHIGDVYAGSVGMETLGSRLMAHLTGAGVPYSAAWGVWHGVIFAASAEQVRQFIDEGHTDFAARHELYRWFKVPDLPSIWARFEGGKMDEVMFLTAVSENICRAV